MELRDKTAIVIAAGTAIGQEIALAFAREGANVVVMDRTAAHAEAVAQNIISRGGMSRPIAGDVTNKSDVEALVVDTLRNFGAVDILVNNVGIEAPPCAVWDVTEQQWDRVLGVSLKGAFLCCQAVVPAMINQNNGRIINILYAVAVMMTLWRSVEYTISKHGMTGLTRYLARELSTHHINVNTICPGGVLTPLTEEETTPEFRDQISRNLVPFGRLCTTDEIAQAAVFLASDRSAMLTGQVLGIDAGPLNGFGEDVRSLVRKRRDAANVAGRG
jgi:NAD(P)-dependent dehydrogenase (short-subunit alcohol dehydrogenase family)